MTVVFGRELAGVVRQGAAMIDDAEVAVQRCRRDPDPDGDLARACGSLVSRYLALDRRAQALPASAATRRVHELLNFHLQIVAQASMLAFRPHDEHWAALAADFGEDLGFPAAELRRLAAEVALDPDAPVSLHPMTGRAEKGARCAEATDDPAPPASAGDTSTAHLDHHPRPG